MNINLTGLQAFHSVINAEQNQKLNGNVRLQGSFQNGILSNITQVKSNKGEAVAQNNQQIRQAFASALLSAFGVNSLEELPKDIRAALKIDDFGVKNGQVTSSRPLTMRRVRAVMDAVKDVAVRGAETAEKAEQVRADFAAHLNDSAYMKAAIDRFAIAEGTKNLTLNIPSVSDQDFDIPLSALKPYIKGIKPHELPGKIEDIKAQITQDMHIASAEIKRLLEGVDIDVDVKTATAIRRYFALAAVAHSEGGISQTVSIPDKDGKIAAYLNKCATAEMKAVHTVADPFVKGSYDVTRFTVDIGFDSASCVSAVPSTK